jgi:hypothetical protein
MRGRGSYRSHLRRSKGWMMSALGHKQTFAPQQNMSALPPKADICSALAHVCFGPKGDIMRRRPTQSATGIGRSISRSSFPFNLASLPRYFTCAPRNLPLNLNGAWSLFVPGLCPLWVISGHLHCNRSCPLYPRERTCAVQNRPSSQL